MHFKLTEIIAGDSFNLNFILEEINTKNEWVGKICRKLVSMNIDFIDLDERALVASHLAHRINVNVPESIYITTKQIQSSRLKRQLMSMVANWGCLYNDQKIFISQYKGKTLPKFLKEQGINDIINKKELIKTFAFDLWIGNYDKKDEDYVVISSGIGYSIDYNLCGPGFRNDNNSSIGYCACKYSLADTGDTGYAIGEILRQQIITNNYKVDFFEEEISKIEALTFEDISSQFTDLTIQRETTYENINQVFINFLIERKALLRNAINEWCNAGYPKIYKDPENCR